MADIKEIVGDWSFMNEIGAKPSNKPFAPIPLELVSETTRNLRGGVPIRLSEFPEEWKDAPIFLDEQSLPFVFYISDQNWLWRWNTSSEYKFHFRWCKTLERMNRAGRSGRYRAKYDICNPVFQINDGRNEKKLKVCLNCCNEFHSEGKAVYLFFDSNRSNIVDKFDMPKFFEKFGVCDLPALLHPGGGDAYTKNWPKIAQREKEKVKWRCQDPSHTGDNNFSNDKKNLHVHHINGVKSHNALDNLEVVCRKCHAKKPGHSHMN